MKITKRFSQSVSQSLLSVAAVGLLGVACSGGLRDYTQVDLRVLPTESGEASAAPKSDESEAEKSAIAPTLAAAESAIETRLLRLGLETAEVTTQTPDQVIVRLPQDISFEAVVETITQPNRLTLRRQKPDTEDELATNIAALQRLLVEQNTLNQTKKLTEAAALQPDIDSTRRAILDLFAPSEVTGEMLLDAQAVQMSGFNIWEVQIWFDAEGADKFAEQTQALAGTGRAIGIFLDDVLLSTPTVAVNYSEEGITGGAANISGNFTAEAARELEQQLKDGALPADLQVVSVTASESEQPDEESQNEELPSEAPTDEAPTDEAPISEE